jgi:hypothetical protein
MLISPIALQVTHRHDLAEEPAQQVDPMDAVANEGATTSFLPVADPVSIRRTEVLVVIGASTLNLANFAAIQ